jgi:hypothetical protein
VFACVRVCVCVRDREREKGCVHLGEGEIECVREFECEKEREVESVWGTDTEKG